MFQNGCDHSGTAENPKVNEGYSPSAVVNNRSESFAKADPDHKTPGVKSVTKMTSTRRIDRLEAEVARLRRRVEELQVAAMSGGWGPTDISTQEDLKDPSVRQSMLEEQLAQESYTAEQLTEVYRDLNDQFQEQPIDPQWAPMAVSTLEKLFFNLNSTGTGLSEVKCRQTLCRMEVVHDNGEAVATFDMELMRLIAGIFKPIGISPAEKENEYLQVYYLERV